MYNCFNTLLFILYMFFVLTVTKFVIYQESNLLNRALIRRPKRSQNGRITTRQQKRFTTQIQPLVGTGLRLDFWSSNDQPRTNPSSCSGRRGYSTIGTALHLTFQKYLLVEKHPAFSLEQECRVFLIVPSENHLLIAKEHSKSSYANDREVSFAPDASLINQCSADSDREGL